MKFSIFMMPLHYPTENPSLAFDRDISWVRYADELGYDEFFIGEHHSGGWETMPAPEMALAKASAHAQRIHLGTSVISVPSSSVSRRGAHGVSRPSHSWPRDFGRRPLCSGDRQESFCACH